jgi:DNA-binding transcriptional LysR family regulator
MRFHQLDLNLLIYLDALLCDKSVSKAAARVNITQPAMSEALSRLREFFGDELLVHIAGRQMILTPLAQSLESPVREILLQAQSIVETTSDFVPAMSTRKFTVETSEYVFDVLFREVLVRLSREAPGVRIDLRPSGLHSADHIKRAEVDLLVVPDNYLADGFPHELIFEDLLTCIVWSGNRLVGSEISFEQYMSSGHVFRRDGAYENWFESRFGRDRKVEITVLDFRMACAAIQGTQRIAAVYLRHARMYEKQYSLRLLKAPVDFPPLKEYIQWHPYQNRDPGLAWFRNLIKSVAAES